MNARFVIFSSYGNDSCALIQLAHEEKLDDVAVVYSDTGWAADGWPERVQSMEAWARSLGFTTARTASIGFGQLAREKKGFPTQRYQWCSWVLKIEPGRRWLDENDPEKKAICLVGARRVEAANKTGTRANFPSVVLRSENHGGRAMVAPMALYSDDERDHVLRRAGIAPIPHRSRECRCINSNKADMRAFTEADVAAIERLEAEIGRPMFRPHRHLGATGVREVMAWAHSAHGTYRREPSDVCDLMWCES
jgi:hypothetical protein